MGKKAIPQATRRAVALRYGCEPGETLEDVPCHWCGVPGRIVWYRLHSGRPGAWVWFSHHLDHVIPEALGGSSEPDNIVLSCMSCNCSRRDRMPDAHYPLTELAAPYSRETHPRKGREGKGVGREGNYGQHAWSLTTRARDHAAPLADACESTC